MSSTKDRATAGARRWAGALVGATLAAIAGCGGDGGPLVAVAESEPQQHCPLDEPLPGDPCDPEGRSCLYADSFQTDGCSQAYFCEEGTWVDSQRCGQPSCPAAIPDGGDPCDAPGEACAYDAGRGGCGAEATCEPDGTWRVAAAKCRVR